MNWLSLCCSFLVLCLPYSEAFTGSSFSLDKSRSSSSIAGAPTRLFGASREEESSLRSNEYSDKCERDLIETRGNEYSSRRALLGTIALTPSAWLLSSPAVSLAAATPSFGATPENPVAILGAGGKTGMEVAQALAREGMYCVTMSRSGRDPFKIIKLKPEVKEYIQHYETGVSVLDKDGMEQALKSVHASAIVYCASASRQGGNAFQVDDEGVGNAAQAALDLKARLVLVSALAVDRPNSKSYQITNTLGGNYQGIMDAKRQGEEKVRSILSRSKDYLILRPGVLLNGVSRNGAIDMEVNQGDTIGGGLSRDELAGVVVGALQTDKRGVTVEVYRRSTATALQPNYSIPSGYETSATTYEGLFENAVSDSKFQSL